MGTTSRCMIIFLSALLVLVCGTAQSETPAELTHQVQAAENAFAQTMVDRDLEAFATFLADEAVFLDGDHVLRGKDAIIAAWSAFFEEGAHPFSWESVSVEVLDSGTLAHSSGPVMNSEGQVVATFNSVWRREPDGNWKVIFDKGCHACPQ